MHKFLGVIRAPFLILTPICLSLGVATAYASGSPLHWGNLVFAFIAALSAHICVNVLNEYFDYKNGLDFKTIRTPFSGGSGVLVEHEGYARTALLIGIVSLLLTLTCGTALVVTAGSGLLPLGVLGVVIVVTYTPWINRYPLTCLIAPGIAFGPIMVVGTHYALTGEFSQMAIWVSLVPLFLVSNLLLLNQFPDVEADRQVGRRHLPIKFGRKTGSLVFGIFFLLAYMAILLAVLVNAFPVWALLGTITLPAALFLFIRVWSSADVVEQIVPVMGLNVVLVLSTPLFLGAGIFFGN